MNRFTSSLPDLVRAQFDQLQAAGKSRRTAARDAINRANAQHSTGPKSPEGKAVSCLNNMKFGLTGARFTVLAWEDRAEFDQLLNGLRDEHQPSTPTEKILVDDMAQHYWLGQRALLLQNLCFDAEEPACEGEPPQKQLALYIRYQTTHQRAFHKCLDQLLKLRAARQKEARGFESQKQQATQPRVRIAKAGSFQNPAGGLRSTSALAQEGGLSGDPNQPAKITGLKSSQRA